MRPGTQIRAAVLVASMVIATLPSGSVAGPTGPVVYHTPVAYATRGQKIGVTAQALCEQRPASPCSARIFYRSTVPGAPAELFASADPTWASLPMGSDAGVNIGTQTLYSFFVELPSSVADTRGVDYIIKVTDGAQVGWSPGAGAARTGAHHTYVTNPATIAHAPVYQSSFRQSIRIRADATCATPCTGRLFFRRTGLLSPTITDLDDPPPAPAEGPDVQWTYVDMTRTATTQSSITDQYGAAPYTFEADIPAAYVDTRGVDYAIRVHDGVTRAFWPGTVYNGYGAPTNGARIGWQHVHVLHPVTAQHVQTQYTAGRGSDVTLRVESICFTATCTATVQYHSFSGQVLTAGMSVEVERGIAQGGRWITFVVKIPGNQVIAPTLGYRFRLSDGYTTVYSPGTGYNGYYVKLDGSQAGEYEIVVL